MPLLIEITTIDISKNQNCLINYLEKIGVIKSITIENIDSEIEGDYIIIEQELIDLMSIITLFPEIEIFKHNTFDIGNVKLFIGV